MHAESRFRIYQFAEQKVRDMLAGLIGSPDTALVSVAIDRNTGEIAGGIAALCVEQWFSAGKVAQDVALFVDQDKRGGIAAASLIDEFIVWAREMGAVTAELGINTGVRIERTALLFERMGLARAAYLYVKEL
jgi:hypothetical protein